MPHFNTLNTMNPKPNLIFRSEGARLEHLRHCAIVREAS
jgi:hypothetical protein